MKQLCNWPFFFSPPHLCNLMYIPSARGQKDVKGLVDDLSVSTVSTFEYRWYKHSIQSPLLLCSLAEVEEGRRESAKQRCILAHSFHTGSETWALVFSVQLFLLRSSLRFGCSMDYLALATRYRRSRLRYITSGRWSLINWEHRLDNTVRMNIVAGWIYVLGDFWLVYSSSSFFQIKHWTYDETTAQVLVLETER